MKNIYSGSSVIDQIYCGEDRIKNVYLGNTLIWTLDADEPTVLVGDWYVSPSGDNANDGKTRNTAFQTINYAIDKANSGDTIVVLAGTYEIFTTLNTGTKTLKIIGEGWDDTTITRASGQNIGLVTLTNGSTIEGFTLTDGRGQYGSGVHVIDGRVSWCRIQNCYGLGNSDAFGAGVSFTNGQGTVDHCIFTGNTGNTNFRGVAIGGDSPSGEMLVDTCLIYGNYTPSTTGWGAAIGVRNSSYNITVRNCTITNNTSTMYGSVYSEGSGYVGKIVLINDVIVGNKNGSGTEMNIQSNG